MMPNMNHEELQVAKRAGLGFSKIANVLETHNAKNGGNIRMDMSENKLNHCGSFMCFAGLYAVATTSEEELERLVSMGYHYGADLIAKECGFKRGGSYTTRGKLVMWAKDNPELWGNENGDDMFLDSIAFGIAEDDNNTLPLDAIIAHLREVAKRCDKA